MVTGSFLDGHRLRPPSNSKYGMCWSDRLLGSLSGEKFVLNYCGIELCLIRKLSRSVTDTLKLFWPGAFLSTLLYPGRL